MIWSKGFVRILGVLVVIETSVKSGHNFQIIPWHREEGKHYVRIHKSIEGGNSISVYSSVWNCKYFSSLPEAKIFCKNFDFTQNKKKFVKSKIDKKYRV